MDLRSTILSDLFQLHPSLGSSYPYSRTLRKVSILPTRRHGNRKNICKSVTHQIPFVITSQDTYPIYPSFYCRNLVPLFYLLFKNLSRIIGCFVEDSLKSSSFPFS